MRYFDAAMSIIITYKQNVTLYYLVLVFGKLELSLRTVACQLAI